MTVVAHMAVVEVRSVLCVLFGLAQARPLCPDRWFVFDFLV